MTDPLGQSQVIPYLQGLVAEGFDITLLSCEKKNPYQKYRNEIATQLENAGIKWEVVNYSKKPPVLSTLYDLFKIRKKAYTLHKKEQFRIVHCRSYISAFIGLWMKRKFGTRFIFDMRGFWADERVEGGIWNLRNPLYKKVYSFFKQKEKQFLAEADHIISLTYRGRSIIHSWQNIPGQPLPISVIPCCVDTDHFDPAKVDPKEREQLKDKLGIEPEDKVLTYLGSLGTWYMVEEMLLFFKELIKDHPEYKFLFITKDAPTIVEEKRKRFSVPKDKVVITASEREQLPTLLSVSNLAISFILPSFSKSASSPTKLGELLSMGVPVICNAGVGDVDFLLKENFSMLLADHPDCFNFVREGRMDKLNPDKLAYRSLSQKHFSLSEGVKAYAKIYYGVNYV